MRTPSERQARRSLLLATCPRTPCGLRTGALTLRSYQCSYQVQRAEVVLTTYYLLLTTYYRCNEQKSYHSAALNEKAKALTPGVRQGMIVGGASDFCSITANPNPHP